MTRPRPRLPRWLSVVLLVAAALAAREASGQGASSFRLTQTVDRSDQARVTVTGRVFNDARADAIDVYVTAEALNESGRVVASGVAYVGVVPSGTSSAFSVRIPAARGAASFRVLVTSFRFGFAVQS
jgi:hypothetical protein